MKKLLVDTTVQILGAEWSVVSQTESEDQRLKSNNGFTDWTTKLICLESEPKGDIGDMDAYMCHVVRHELVHAFMFESGLGDCLAHIEYGHEETVVDWFAFQTPKIEEAAQHIYKHMEWVDIDKE